MLEECWLYNFNTIPLCRVASSFILHQLTCQQQYDPLDNLSLIDELKLNFTPNTSDNQCYETKSSEDRLVNESIALLLCVWLYGVSKVLELQGNRILPLPTLEDVKSFF